MTPQPTHDLAADSAARGPATPAQATAARFREAVEARDLAAIEALFTEDIRFYSPVKFTPFEGKPLVVGLFGVLLRLFEDFRYLGGFEGAAETSADGTEAPAVVLPFRTTVHGKEIHGIDLLHVDEAGLIKEFTVMVRPLSAVRTLGDAVLAGLVEAGLVPAPEAG
ncbi:nuclear transport factor 2 family protein [Streptomyces physcomitrii]|uniref:Nuclear transport factor 2 family protein n=1 Tax=Streptomyces physcomitrii TaxID=2724184 RepID=A0ABX1GYE0_9ACTN|nr:nuclear transport factor 2 family protein [Streptomyces physcomitrii]NKI40807.1 nuclear transport factor 2 family protein [Streptomyces physcomitrii]